MSARPSSTGPLRVGGIAIDQGISDVGQVRRSRLPDIEVGGDSLEVIELSPESVAWLLASSTPRSLNNWAISVSLTVPPAEAVVMSALMIELLSVEIHDGIEVEPAAALVADDSPVTSDPAPPMNAGAPPTVSGM